LSLSRLALTNFRNYEAAEFAPGPGFVVLMGENGAGKTNVLEAVSLLAPGRGLRGAVLSEMARSGGQGGFGVSAELGDVALGTGTLATAPERRIVRINGATASANALSEWLSIVWLTPAMDRLFTDTPGSRRRFIDRLVLALYPKHAFHSARYDAAMRQRNRLLAEDRPDPDWLTALEVAMGEHGGEITRARMEVVTSLNTVILGIPNFDSEGLPYLASEQEAEYKSFPRSKLVISNSTNGYVLTKRLAASRATHTAAGRTLIGPHTEDLLVTYVGKAQPAARCSTGEQKALLLGIVLAHADLVAERVQRRPILLLDEVAAHLDPPRRAALFERLAAGDGQVWMTGTERALFSDLGTGSTWLKIHDGKVQQN